MNRLRLIGVLTLVAVATSSCEYNVENEDELIDASCVANPVSYSATIAPLITNNCMPCHNGDGTFPDAPDLTNYSSVESVANLIKQVTQSGRMPKNGTLPASEIEAIKCWVDNGALEN